MKHTKLLWIILILAWLVSACGGQAVTTKVEPTQAAPAQEEPTQAQPTQPVAASGEKITLRLWSHQNAAFQEGNDAIIQKFMQQNPNIEVKYETFEYELYIQTLQTSMPAGTEADVIEMFGTWVCSYANGGRLLTVPEELLTYASAKEIYFQAPLDGYYCGGNLYGIPHEFNLENGGVLVNPALFEAHGVAYPPQWADFSSLVADAKKMSEFDGETMSRAGFDFVTGDGVSFTFLAMILQQGSSYFADDGKHFNFNTPEARQAIQLMVDMAQKDKVVDPVTFNDTSNWVGDSFFAGNVAIGFVGSWAAGEGLINYPDMKFDYVQIPPYFGTENKFAADSGWGKVVSVNTKHPNEAWKLAMFMAGEKENALIWNKASKTIPAMKELVEKPDAILQGVPYLKSTFGLLPGGQFIGDLTDRDQLFYEIIYPHILDAMQGVTTVDEAVDLIHTEANAIVDAK